MIAKHYYYFGERMTGKFNGDGRELNSVNWDALRIDDEKSPFAIEKTVEAYETNCMQASSYKVAAEIIVSTIKRNSWTGRKVISCGVGKGILEWHIKKLCPELHVGCTDYAEKSIDRLKAVFTAMDDGYTFDMINGDYSALGDDPIIIMFRVSTEFNREQWERVFRNMYSAGINTVFFVPTELATPAIIAKAHLSHIRNIIKGHKDTFCGWLYSENEFLKMFAGANGGSMYEVKEKTGVENTAVYLLNRRD